MKFCSYFHYYWNTCQGSHRNKQVLYHQKDFRVFSNIDFLNRILHSEHGELQSNRQLGPQQHLVILRQRLCHIHKCFFDKNQLDSLKMRINDLFRYKRFWTKKILTAIDVWSTGNFVVLGLELVFGLIGETSFSKLFHIIFLSTSIAFFLFFTMPKIIDAIFSLTLLAVDCK